MSVRQSLTEYTVSVLGHCNPFSEVTSLQTHVFRSCSNGKQALHENQCGIEKEGDRIQLDSKVGEVTHC